MAATTILLFVAVGGSAVACVLIGLVLLKLDRGLGGLNNFSAFTKALEQTLQGIAPTLREESRVGRDELRNTLGAHQQALDGRLTNFGQLQVEQLSAMRREAAQGRTALEEALKRNTDAFSETQTRRLAETNVAMRELADRLQMRGRGRT
jgi:DNA recombination protein RmuC